MLYVVIDKTYRGPRGSHVHSIQATAEDADRVVEELRGTTTSTHAKTLIIWEKREFGEEWY